VQSSLKFNMLKMRDMTQTGTTLQNLIFSSKKQIKTTKIACQVVPPPGEKRRQKGAHQKHQILHL
jgi:hypothetical protein